MVSDCLSPKLSLDGKLDGIGSINVSLYIDRSPVILLNEKKGLNRLIVLKVGEEKNEKISILRTIKNYH